MGSRNGVVLAEDDPRHGSPSTYSNWKCRCDACRAAWRERCREYQHRCRGRRPAAEYHADQKSQADARDNHGTETRYKRGCRCALCVRGANEGRRSRRAANPEAARAYNRAYRGYAPLRAVDAADDAKLIRRAELLEEARTSADGELADLIAQQQRDEGIVRIGARWMIRLDAPVKDVEGEPIPPTLHDLVGVGTRFLRSHETEAWTDVVCAVVDRRREIDAWAEAAA